MLIFSDRLFLLFFCSFFRFGFGNLVAFSWKILFLRPFQLLNLCFLLHWTQVSQVICKDCTPWLPLDFVYAFWRSPYTLHSLSWTIAGCSRRSVQLWTGLWYTAKRLQAAAQCIKKVRGLLRWYSDCKRIVWKGQAGHKYFTGDQLPSGPVNIMELFSGKVNI